MRPVLFLKLIWIPKLSAKQVLGTSQHIDPILYTPPRKNHGFRASLGNQTTLFETIWGVLFFFGWWDESHNYPWKFTVVKYLVTNSFPAWCRTSQPSSDRSLRSYFHLVGGLEPWNFIFPSYWECHHPNWRIHSIIFQRDRAQPPTRLLLTIINHIITYNNHHH